MLRWVEYYTNQISLNTFKKCKHIDSARVRKSCYIQNWSHSSRRNQRAWYFFHVSDLAFQLPSVPGQLTSFNSFVPLRLPCIDTYIKVDLRTVTFDVPPQEVRLTLLQFQNKFKNCSLIKIWYLDFNTRFGHCLRWRRCLLSHIQCNHLSHQCRGRSQIHKATGRLNTPQHPGHKVIARDPIRSRVCCRVYPGYIGWCHRTVGR